MSRGGNNKIFSPEVAKQVIDLFAQGKPIQDIAQEIGVDINTIQNWRLQNPSFDSECSRARYIGYEVQADSLLKIPDEYHDVNKARLKSDSIKWLLARRAPDRYGDRLTVDLNQTVDIGAALKEAKERILPNNQVIVESQISQGPDITHHLLDSVTDKTSEATESNSNDTPEIKDADKSDKSSIFD